MFWEAFMRKSSTPLEVRKRLLRHGFGRAYADRTARELEDHWDEVIGSLLAAGMSLDEAETEAVRRLGSAKALADELTLRMRQSSWLGRYPTLAFAMIALTLTMIWWVSFGSLAASFCGIFRDTPAIGPRLPLKMDLLADCFDWIRASSYVVLPSLCCHIADRFACGWRPALWACLVLSVHNAMHVFRVSGGGEHGNVAWGYSFHFDSMPGLIPIFTPIAVFALWRAWNFRDEFHIHNSNPTRC